MPTAFSSASAFIFAAISFRTLALFVGESALSIAVSLEKEKSTVDPAIFTLKVIVAVSAVSISGGSITGIGSPSGNTDVANKSYVDQAIAGLRDRTVAECASTANVNISNALEAGDAITVQAATGSNAIQGAISYALIDRSQENG